MATSHATVKFATNLIQNNIVGLPVLHEEQTWPFDPEVGIRRSREYQRINGRYGELAIEKLGLGEDGYEEERRAQQAERDRGQLNGAGNAEEYAILNQFYSTKYYL